MNTSRLNRKDGVLSWLFLCPLFIILLIFMCYAFINGFLLSIKDANGSYIGLSYFTSLLGEVRFTSNLINTLIYVCATVLAATILGLLSAHLITNQSKLVSVIRPLYLIPWIIPPVASGIIFRSLFDGNAGPIPKLLKLIAGKTVLPIGDMKLAIWTCVIHEFWRSFPFAMLFIAAGLTTISKDIYEAATIDGAGKWEQFISVTFPLLRSHLFIVVLMLTNSTLQSTEAIYTLTAGGPGYSSETIAVRMFRSAFVYNEINLGAALGILLLLITTVLMVVYNRALKINEAGNENV